MQCPSCHVAVAPNDRFCQNCGHAIAVPATVPVQSPAAAPSASSSKRSALIFLLIAIVAAAVVLWPKIQSTVLTHLTGKASSPSSPPASPPSVKTGTLTETPATQPAPVPPVSNPADSLSSLSKTLLGSWRGGRHLTEFRADGTFLLDADIVPEPAGGVWKLEGRRLTLTYREGNAIVLDIVSIEGRDMLARDPAKGIEFKYRREDNAYLSPDQIATGDMSGDEFAAKGLRMKPLTGSRLYVYDAVAPMAMPGVRKKVIMIDGDRITKLGLEFDPPVRSFSITLPGLTGGSSFPTFTMTAFNRAGLGFDVIGREHWIPTRPVTETIKMDAREIARIEIAVDNRFGDTAWATFNCLPIMDMLLER